MNNRLYFIVLLVFGGLLIQELSAQKLVLRNEDGRKLHRYKKGRTIDFRTAVDYFPNYGFKQGTREVRALGVIDSIIDEDVFLSETILILSFDNHQSVLIEQMYEGDLIKLNYNDIRGMSYTSSTEALGNGLFSVGIGTIAVSLFFGINDGPYAWERVAIVAGLGAASAISGFILEKAFKSKPVRLKNFEGVDYFDEYISGTLQIE